MISMKLLAYLSIGTIAMLIPIVVQAARYKIKRWKSIPIAVALTVSGTIGTYLWFFIENHWIGGTSFYGAVFVVPIMFLLVAKVLCISYKELIDLCAPAECVMLAIMKVQCLISGCCAGRVLFTTAAGKEILFPSQIAELLLGLLLSLLLLKMSDIAKFRGAIYPWYMVIYGNCRFILNFFRANTSPFVWILPPGHFWSVLAVLIGVIWLTALKKRKEKNAAVDCEV